MVKSIGDLKKKDKQFDQQIEVAERQIEAFRKRAREKAKKKDKRGALFEIRKMKQKQKRVEQLQKYRLNVQNMIMTLESAATAKTMMNAMSDANSQMKHMQKDMNPDKLDDIRSDMEDRLADQEEVDSMLAEPMGNMDMEDDEDLLKELEDLTAGPVGAKVPDAGIAGTLPSVPVNDPVILPKVPTMEPTPSKVEEDELAGLEAMLN